MCLFPSEDCSMHVKAQVMTRDESTGGWVPLGGGGMSLVGLQRNSAKNGAAEYTIIGQKLSDQTVNSLYSSLAALA